MHRTSNTFSVLQATAAVVTLAIVLWSIGLPSFQLVEAAALTTFSDTLSDSAPSASSDHTIVFTTPTGVAAAETIVITFPDEANDFDLSTIGAEDIDLASTTGDYSLQNGAAAGETWGVSTSTFAITLTSGTAVLNAGETVTIEIGEHALFGGGTQSQIVNPAAVLAGSYDLNVSAGSSDSGETKIAIIENVTVTASVDTVLNFAVAGVADGETVHGTSTGTTTSATAIAFGELNPNEPRTGAQDLTITTNAANGFTVTVTADGQLTSGGADIDGFSNGAYNETPIVWAPPSEILSNENTWGHWGIISDDGDLFPTEETWVSASTTPVDIMTYTGPVTATTTRVGYTVEISPLQEASENYQAILTYVATPVF